jgi:hypothetical protein
MMQSQAVRQHWQQSGRSTVAVDSPGSLLDRSSCCTGHIQEPFHRFLVLQLCASEHAQRLAYDDG